MIRGITITVDYGGSGQIVAEIDKDKITQVFRNLISNAIKFSPNGSNIHAQFAIDANDVLFSLTDAGHGIPENELKAIFDKFFQSTRNIAGSGGTGLGLLICREYVIRHHGQIWAENNPAGGSTFCIRLPLRQAEQQLT